MISVTNEPGKVGTGQNVLAMVNTMAWFRGPRAKSYQRHAINSVQACLAARSSHGVHLSEGGIFYQQHCPVLCSVCEQVACQRRQLRPACSACCSCGARRKVHIHTIDLPASTVQYLLFILPSGYKRNPSRGSTAQRLRSHHASFLSQDRRACKELSAAPYYRLFQEDG